MLPHPLQSTARACLVLLSVLSAPLVMAQTAPAAAAAADSISTLGGTVAAAPTSTLLITANPLGNRISTLSSSVLAGEALLLQRGATLGETLESLPGVSASGFGPHASRPLLRGLDGERLRLLSNHGTLFDASSLSDDHAVALDPLIATRIEVLRGPAALFFGGNALAGVVNVLDNRIPDLPQRSGLQGSVEMRAGSAARERNGAVVIEGGTAGRFAWHVDAYGRESGDLRVPRHIPGLLPDQMADAGAGSTAEASTRIANSAGRGSGGAVGARVTAGAWQLGAAVDTLSSRYGVIASPDIAIDLQRDQLRLQAERDWGTGPLRSLKIHGHLNDYRHREIEGDGHVGTEFRNRGSDVRIEARHAPVGELSGVVGAQLESGRFAADGEEAFVPASRTRRQSVFFLEQMPAFGGTLSGGARIEQARIASQGDLEDGGRFGPGVSRRLTLRSASLGHVQPLGSHLHASLSWSHSERAPTSFELFANGPHAATGAFERGDPSLGPEVGRNTEAALIWRNGPHHWRVAAFHTRFSRFIALRASGQQVDPEGHAATADAGEALPFYRFEGVRARLQGVEFEGVRRLVDAGWTVDATLSADVTHGRNQDTGEPLPRMAPARVRAALLAARGAWVWRVGVRHAARQDRVPTGDVATPAHTLVDGSLSWRWTSGNTQGLAYLRVQNLTHALAYNASALPTVRGLAPAAGRALSVGLRLDY